MVQVVLPSGFIYHTPPYTDEELADLYRRVSDIVAFTRPSALKAHRLGPRHPSQEPPEP
jgi:hypothetical protein